jgi:16S rRNA (guanine(966)-N(2))-methyltransferase RsmD
VIAGKYKGRPLHSPKGLTVRPMPDRLKESVFNVLQWRISGATVLDVCAGTGAVGIEALSRGADRVVFVDAWPTAVEALRQNLQRCRAEPSSYHIIVRDALAALRRLAAEGATFDIIFFDPPYASDLYESVMALVGDGALLRAESVVIVMHHSKKGLAERYGVLERGRALQQGENVLSFYRFNPVELSG